MILGFREKYLVRGLVSIEKLNRPKRLLRDNSLKKFYRKETQKIKKRS